MSGYLVPGDEGFYDDNQFMADLAALNGQLSRYVLRLLDADAKQAEPVSASDEWAFAETLQAMADRLQQRAERRAAPDTPPALEENPTLRRSSNGRPSERG